MDSFRRILNSRVFLWLVLACPFVWQVLAWRAGDVFYGEMIHFSGELSTRLLLVTLAITPLRMMFSRSRWPAWLLSRRRYFGVASFVYAMLHTLVYIDRKQSIDLIIKEGMSFSLWTGWLALAIFLALAITSNDQAVRAMRLTWKKLHLWVYPAALLTFLHWIFVAYDFVPGLNHLGILLALELYRILHRKKATTRAT